VKSQLWAGDTTIKRPPRFSAWAAAFFAMELARAHSTPVYYLVCTYIVWTSLAVTSLKEEAAAVALALAVTALLGVLIDRMVYRPLRKKNADERALLLASIGVFIFLQGLALLLFLFQSRLVFYPQMDRTLSTTPAQIGLSFEEVNLKAADGVALHGWYVPAAEPRGTILFMHGNAGNISHRLD